MAEDMIASATAAGMGRIQTSLVVEKEATA